MPNSSAIDIITAQANIHESNNKQSNNDKEAQAQAKKHEVKENNEEVSLVDQIKKKLKEKFHTVDGGKE